MVLKVVVLLLCMQFASSKEKTILSDIFFTPPVGRIRGQAVSFEYSDGDRILKYSSFLGIPYAKPPVGNLRFRKPEKPEPWEGTFEADRMPPACPQHSEYPYPWYDSLPGKSEDCLYLNVFITSDGNYFQPRPVKLYIHGGGWFTHGSNRMEYYQGQGDTVDLYGYNDEVRKDLPETLGVVVVTINYRLGALGFFTSGTDDAPGNVALYDMLMAMEWVNENIAAFGGDPALVTLVGQGAGAIASSLFFLSPLAVDLFQRAILTGGTFYSTKDDKYDDNLKLGQRLAEGVGCNTSLQDNPGDTMACMRGVNATRIVQVLSSFDPTAQSVKFLPQYGHDDLLPLDPATALKNYKFNPAVGLYFVFTSDEGSHLLTTARPEVFGVFGENDVGVNATAAKSILKGYLKDYPEEVADDLLGDLDEDATTENRKKLSRAMGDESIVCPIVYLAEAYADIKRGVYVVEKKLNPFYNPWAEWMGSVHFNNVQLDFFHRDGELTVNGRDYNLTKVQYKTNALTKLDQASFMYTGISKYKGDANTVDNRVKFTSKDRLYSFDDQGVIDQLNPEKSNPGGHNCEVLRPYFMSNN